MAVNNPDTTSEKLLTTPVSGSNSFAAAVAIIWPEVPRATPCADFSFSRKRLKRYELRTFAIIPVRMIEAVVIEGIPPESSLSGTPIAVVTLLGNRETVRECSRPTIEVNASRNMRQPNVPPTIPISIAFIFFLRSWIFSYMGIASEIVAGVINQEIMPISA